MFEIADFLLPFYKQLLAQEMRFVASRGTGIADFSVAPVTKPMNEGDRLQLRYAESDYSDGDYLATTTIMTKRGTSSFRSGLRTALEFLTFSLDSTDNLNETVDLNPTASIALAAERYGLDGETLSTPRVESKVSGYHIAETADGSHLYFVEERGEIVPVAESDRSAILCHLIYAFHRRTDTDIAGRSARLEREHLRK